MLGALAIIGVTAFFLIAAWLLSPPPLTECPEELGDQPLGTIVTLTQPLRRNCARCRGGKIWYRRRWQVVARTEEDAAPPKAFAPLPTLVFCSRCEYRGIQAHTDHA